MKRLSKLVELTLAINILIIGFTFSIFSPTAATAGIVVDSVKDDVDPSNPSNWDDEDSVYAGKTSNGKLTVNNGSDIESRWAKIGWSEDAIGLVTITGSGSTWTNVEHIRIAQSGNGTLEIRDNAKVTNVGGYIGMFTGASGHVLVTGDDSQWLNHDAFNGGDLLVGDWGHGTLEISDGGYVSNLIGIVGGNSNQDNRVTVSGSGSKWNNFRWLYVGDHGRGTLEIKAGGRVDSAYGFLGVESGSTGTAIVTGSGSQWDIELDIGFPDDPPGHDCCFVGLRGDGDLEISNGGCVSNSTGYIGAESGATGSVSVTGSNSSWTNTNDLYIGQGGDGSLIIGDGGSVGNDAGYIGSESGSIGAVTVSNATWNNTETLYVGDAGDAGLSIVCGGSVENTQAYIANGADSTATVLVNGSGSAWGNSGKLYVGNAGDGTLKVENGASVGNTYGYIADDSGSTGEVIVTGGSSTWTNSEKLFVGVAGAATLEVTAGGQVSSTHGYVGYSDNSTGEVSVTNADSAWNVAADYDDPGDEELKCLFVGYEGHGELTIGGGGSVANAHGYIGNLSGSTGAVTVTGSNSTWTNSNILYVGYSGKGTLTIEDGGSVGNTLGYIGKVSGATNSVTVRDGGSAWANSDDLYVGYSGKGALTVENGGNVSCSLGCISNTLTSNGSVTVTGGDSTWTCSDDLYVCYAGYGSLTISDGGMVENAAGYIAYADYLGDINKPCHGTVNVTGAGSTWKNNGTLNVGRDGLSNFTIQQGSLTVSAGGQVFSTGGTVGTECGAYGLATVTGDDSKWSISGRLYVCKYGRGSMTVSDGGKVSNTTGYIGLGFSAGNFGSIFGKVVVRDAGSTWTNDGTLYVGYYENGFLEIKDGATVKSTDCCIGTYSPSTGDVLVSGTDSLWMNYNDLVIGNRAPGKLEIKADGDVISSLSYIGARGGSTGTATVSGNGSTWTCDGLYVGGLSDTVGGTGSLKVSDYALVDVAGTMKIWETGAVTLAGGTVECGSFEMVADSTLCFELGSLFTDGIVSEGDASLDGLLDVKLLEGFQPLLGDVFTLLDVGGNLSGEFNGLAEGALIGTVNDVNLILTYTGGDGNDVCLTAANVPEPSSIILALFALAGLFIWRRRQV